MRSIDEIQKELKVWQEHNFPGRDYLQPALGTCEEIGELAQELESDDPHLQHLMVAIGELAHHTLKMKQDIRGSAEEHEERMRDAMADITIFMMDIHNAFGWSYHGTIDHVWNEVRRRNWRPEKGNIRWPSNNIQ